MKRILSLLTVVAVLATGAVGYTKAMAPDYAELTGTISVNGYRPSGDVQISKDNSNWITGGVSMDPISLDFRHNQYVTQTVYIRSAQEHCSACAPYVYKVFANMYDEPAPESLKYVNVKIVTNNADVIYEGSLYGLTPAANNSPVVELASGGDSVKVDMSFYLDSQHTPQYSFDVNYNITFWNASL